MPLFGSVHLAWLGAIAPACIVTAWVCRRSPEASLALRLTVGTLLAVNELIW